MDCPFPAVADDGDLPWSDCRSMDSMDSDDSHSMAIPNSPLWMDHIPSSSASMSVSSTISISHTGQLSPISTSMDLAGTLIDHSASLPGASGPSSTPNLIHSASSTCTDSWSIGYADMDEAPGTGGGSNDGADIHWEQDSDDILTVAKLEPLDDDDIRLDDLKEAPLSTLTDATDPAATQPKVKRPRGRPRKHPLTPIVTTNKVTKGRSKTGCLTCRKRKKKCDEAKPRCMNCEKNAVVCEGYPEKQIWKSGKERAEEERLKSQLFPSITMQPIFHGLETVEDRIFWKHYNEQLSNVLTVEGEHKNAFKDMIVPIAVTHEGLMHSILSLASKHIDYDTPYGVNLLRNNPGTSREALQERSDFHHETAMEKLYADLNREHDGSSLEYKDILSARYGQMLCLLLESIAEGNSGGDHRIHLQAYRNLIQQSPPEDPAFFSFITEFFQYHIFADELIYLPDVDTHRPGSANWLPLSPIHPPRMLGVADGLFNYLSHITTIRNTIRANMESQIDPVVDYTSLYQAAEIDAAIREWTPSWPPGDSRDRVGLLYKQMMWIYLFRSIYPPSTSSSSLSSSGASLSMLAGPSCVGRSVLVNTPPHSASTSTCSSSPGLLDYSDTSSASSRSDPRSNPPSRKSSSANAPTLRPDDQQAEQPHVRADSPQPIRQPPNHDPRITIAIEESLTILDSFKPSDPSQTLLLIPCLVIGTACFSPAQQDRIRAAVRTVRGYTGLRNTDRVTELLEEVWRLMDAGDWAAVWDWQTVARNSSLDFLCA